MMVIVLVSIQMITAESFASKYVQGPSSAIVAKQ